MDVIALMGISYILGLYSMFYAIKHVGKIFKDEPTSSNLDGLRR